MRLPFLRAGFFGRRSRDVFLVVGGDALQAADRDRLGLLALVFLHAAAAARGLARTVAGAPEDAGEDVRFPVDHVRIAVAALRDQADVFGNRRVGGTRPLAIDHLVEVVGMTDIGRLQKAPPPLLWGQSSCFAGQEIAPNPLILQRKHGELRKPGGLVHELVLHRVAHQLRVALHLHLAQDAVAVGADGIGAQGRARGRSRGRSCPRRSAT